MTIAPVSLATARALLDFRAGQGPGRGIPQDMAEAQLRGAVAIQRMLAERRFAYLADEVGMGKTYVALGAINLLRFQKPALRVAVIAPRENIQDKWIKELHNFARGIWREPDQRVRSVQDLPAFDHVRCDSLADWVRHTARRPGRDVFLRMTSFSLQLVGDGKDGWSSKREELRRLAPGLDLDDLDGRKNKEDFKDAYARAVRSLLPRYDLLVVDEAHNLKGGRDTQVARNRVLATILGTAEGEGPRLFERVLLLSATPIESDMVQLWRQLDLFGVGEGDVARLQEPDLPEQAKREIVKSFLVRRLTTLSIGGKPHTKNLYRLEWRGGGCSEHDQPLTIDDPRQRLVVALVQKKVAEVTRDERFGPRFQMGMLASFESFGETARARVASSAHFDDAEQTDHEAERQGMDATVVSRLARSHMKKFGHAMPHPKMDALVTNVASSFDTGDKTLIFVRRIRSVDELCHKLSHAYDKWLEGRLGDLVETDSLRRELEGQWTAYRQDRLRRGPGSTSGPARSANPVPDGEDPITSAVPVEDGGGHDTFFAWFFRGEGPDGVHSGAHLQSLLGSAGSVFSTFFDDNHVAGLLGATPDEVVLALAAALEYPADEVEHKVRRLAWQAARWSDPRREPPHHRVHAAYQSAGLQLLVAGAGDPVLRDEAAVLLRERYPAAPGDGSRLPSVRFPDAHQGLATRTFFTELRARPALRDAIWPEAPRRAGAGAAGDAEARVLDRERRRELLSSVARLGHPSIELWALSARATGSLRRAARSTREDVDRLIGRFVARLDEQRRESARGGRSFDAFQELSAVGQNHDLLVAVNFPDLATRPLRGLPRLFADKLARQSPVAGMHGGVAKNVVTQFRMPGYPLALVTTDVLQEGEDLHTFCSRVVHYGISWTPSAMEQKTGRVDRIGSSSQRALQRVDRLEPGAMVRVQYPYLAETVEVLQVHKLFEGMNRFLRTMHELEPHRAEAPTLSIDREAVGPGRDVEPIRELLTSPFEAAVDEDDADGIDTAVDAARAGTGALVARFDELIRDLGRHLAVTWDATHARADRYGTVWIRDGRLMEASAPADPRSRVQPFALYLRTIGGGRTVLHASSPVGIVTRDDATPAIHDLQRRLRGAKLCRLPPDTTGSYTLTAEGDLLVGPGTRPEALAVLVRDVALAADEAERELLHDDRPLSHFAESLRKEATGAGA